MPMTAQSVPDGCRWGLRRHLRVRTFQPPQCPRRRCYRCRTAMERVALSSIPSDLRQIWSNSSQERLKRKIAAAQTSLVFVDRHVLIGLVGWYWPSGTMNGPRGTATSASTSLPRAASPPSRALNRRRWPHRHYHIEPRPKITGPVVTPRDVTRRLHHRARGGHRPGPSGNRRCDQHAIRRQSRVRRQHYRSIQDGSQIHVAKSAVRCVGESGLQAGEARGKSARRALSRPEPCGRCRSAA